VRAFPADALRDAVSRQAAGQHQPLVEVRVVASPRFRLRGGIRRKAGMGGGIQKHDRNDPRQ
jgi:hypothetical protein